MKDLWRSRLKGQIDRKTVDYLSSLQEDARLKDIDIDVVEAHSIMLFQQGYITKPEIKKILSSLEKVRKVNLRQIGSLHDIHPMIEKYVIDTCGVEIGGKIHLGKSRNDQVVADIRIYLRNELINIMDSLTELIDTFLSSAKKNIKTIMPGYTHSQPAQVITLCYYLLSYVDIFIRSISRLNEIYTEVNFNPLGAGPLAGTNINIDRKYTSRVLGFDGILENTIDAVSNRDFMLLSGAELTNIMVTLSRIAEDIILWSSYESGILEISDRLADTSSAMAQKKNPDPLELLRAKCSTCIGCLSQMYTTLKGLQTGYNRDLQELKPALWQIIDITNASINIMTSVIESLSINKERMLNITNKSNITAPDLTEFLVTKCNLSFREAIFLVGNIVRRLTEEGKTLLDLTTDVLTKMAKEILSKKISLPAGILKKVIKPEFSILQKKSLGMLSPVRTRQILANRVNKLTQIRRLISDKKVKIGFAKRTLLRTVNKLSH